MPPLKIITQHDGIVVFRGSSAEYQGHLLRSGRVEGRLPGDRIAVESRKLPPLEFFPLGRIVAKPLAQLCARSDVL